MNARFQSLQIRRSFLAIVTVAVLGTGLVACTEEPMPVPTPTITATPLPAGDGVLTIGTLLPTTGASTFLAKAQDAGVELAVREINEAGGVNGEPVAVYHRDSGDATSKKAESSLEDLVSKNVDVIIGPSSSVLAERLLPLTVKAGVVMISPSATSPVLSTLKDQGMLFRTVPSAALEGAALAEAMGKDHKVAIIFFADETHSAIQDQLETRIDAVGGTLVASERFTTSSDAGAIVASVSKAEPDAVILASPFNASAKNKEIILALAKVKLTGSKLWLTSQNLGDYSQALPAGTLTDVNGILEGRAADAEFEKRVKGADPTVSDFRYAAEAYDATILAALAAIVSGNDTGRAVAANLGDVSASGIKCLSFGECLDVLKARTDIDYDGISGPISFDQAGDPQRATYGLYRYAADNKFKSVGSVNVEAQ